MAKTKKKYYFIRPTEWLALKNCPADLLMLNEIQRAITFRAWSGDTF